MRSTGAQKNLGKGDVPKRGRPAHVFGEAPDDA